MDNFNRDAEMSEIFSSLNYQQLIDDDSCAQSGCLYHANP